MNKKESEGCGNCKHREGCKIDNIYKCFLYEKVDDEKEEDV